MKLSSFTGSEGHAESGTDNLGHANLSARIKNRAHGIGFDLVGITTGKTPLHAGEFRSWLARNYHGEMAYMAKNAHKRVAPPEVLPDVVSVVVVALNYYTDDNGSAVKETGDDRASLNGQDVPDRALGASVDHGHIQHRQPEDHGRIARYAWGSRDYHDLMAGKLKQLSAAIEEIGGAGTRSKWYVDTGPILERDLSQRAGIGFIGKHTNLISRSLGNWIFLGEILTNLGLEPDAPEREYCGTCSRCIEVCPTRAIVAPYKLDARLCISYLTIELKGSIPVELRPLIGDRVFGCDDCLEVCPWNRFAKTSREISFQRRQFPRLTEFLWWDDKKFRDYFRGTPIFRIRRRGFLRNVCVALGNVGDPSALPALEHARIDPEPLVREHAQWAIDEIQRRNRE